MRGVVSAAGRAVRLGEWWGFKLGPVLAVALVEVLRAGVPPLEAAVRVGLIAVSGGCIAAYGHVVNDAADIAADAAAGKPNALAAWPPWARAAAALGLLAAAFGVWVARPISAAALALLAAEAAALALYALPPARLKARGVLGVAADAAYAHVLPTLFVLAVFGEGWGAWGAALGVWAAAYGARGILLHQLWDADNDRVAGVPTFASARRPAEVRRWGRWAFGVEVAAAGAVVALLGARAPVLAAALAAVTLLTAVAKWRGWARVKRSFDPMPTEPGTHVPLTLTYVVWPGLLVGAALVAQGPGYLPLAAGYALLFPHAIVSVGTDWLAGLPPRYRRPLRRAWARLRGR